MAAKDVLCCVRMPAALQAFLDRTYAAVGAREEFLELDKLLEEFLAR
ncbi:hypothetical protein [Streptomyces xanthophaeus]